MPYGTSSSRKRHDHARCQSSNTAIAGFARDAEPGVRHQSQDSGEVAQTGDDRGSEDRAKGTSFNDLDRGRRGNGRCVPAAHVAATG